MHRVLRRVPVERSRFNGLFVLVERLGGEIVGCSFIIDLPDLGGRERLEKLGMKVHTLVEFEGA